MIREQKQIEDQEMQNWEEKAKQLLRGRQRRQAKREYNLQQKLKKLTEKESGGGEAEEKNDQSYDPYAQSESTEFQLKSRAYSQFIESLQRMLSGELHESEIRELRESPDIDRDAQGQIYLPEDQKVSIRRFLYSSDEKTREQEI